MLKYQCWRPAIAFTTKHEGAKIFAQASTTWTAEVPAQIHHLEFRVEGNVQERGATWFDVWQFEFENGDTTNLEQCIAALQREVEIRAPGKAMVDVSAKVYPWLTIGTIFSETGVGVYVRFLHPATGQTMQASFANAGALKELRDIVWRAKNSH